MDKIAIALTNDASYRIYAAVTTGLVREAQKMHNSYPVATAALGRALTAAAMMGAMIKSGNGGITIQIKGDGPLGTVLAVSDANSAVRGYCSNPGVIMPPRVDGKLDVGGAVGKNGFINVVRDTGSGQPYTGNVPLVSGEIAEDLTSYFAVSEQIPTAVGLGVLVGTDGVPEAAGGFIVQRMPGAGPNDEQNAEKIENVLKNLSSITEIISKHNSPDSIIDLIFKDIEHNIIDYRSTCYKCTCDKKRVEKALSLIGEADLQSLIDDDKDAQISCSFCNKTYTFSRQQLTDILKRIKKG